MTSRNVWLDIKKHPAPADVKAMFWLDWADDCAPLNAPMHDSERLFIGYRRTWSSIYKATHWRALQVSPPAKRRATRPSGRNHS